MSRKTLAVGVGAIAAGVAARLAYASVVEYPKWRADHDNFVRRLNEREPQAAAASPRRAGQ